MAVTYDVLDIPWWEPCRIVVTDDDGTRVYEGPKFFRCYYQECRALVTHGQIERYGKCPECSGRKLGQAHKLTEGEKESYLNREYLMTTWEEEMIFGRQQD